MGVNQVKITDIHVDTAAFTGSREMRYESVFDRDGYITITDDVHNREIKLIFYETGQYKIELMFHQNGLVETQSSIESLDFKEWEPGSYWDSYVNKASANYILFIPDTYPINVKLVNEVPGVTIENVNGHYWKADFIPYVPKNAEVKILITPEETKVKKTKKDGRTSGKNTGQA